METPLLGSIINNKSFSPFSNYHFLLPNNFNQQSRTIQDYMFFNLLLCSSYLHERNVPLYTKYGDAIKTHKTIYPLITSDHCERTTHHELNDFITQVIGQNKSELHILYTDFYSVLIQHPDLLAMLDDFNININDYRILLENFPIVEEFFFKHSSMNYTDDKSDEYLSNVFRGFRDTYIRKYNIQFEQKTLNETQSEQYIITDKFNLHRMLQMVNNTAASRYSYDVYTCKMSKNDTKYININPNMAKIFNEPVVSIKDIMNMLDINPKELAKTLSKVKSNKINLVIIGLGGAMSNFCYFAEQFAQFVDINKPFKEIVLFENDELEFSNLFRIPLDYLSSNHTLTTEVYSQIKRVIRGNSCPHAYSQATPLNKGFMLFNHPSLYENYTLVPEYFSDQDYIKLSNSKTSNVVFLGGPDNDTRRKISEMANSSYITKKRNFICTLHGDNTVNIFNNPYMGDTSLLIETYGSIDLVYFHLNMAMMTYKVLQLLAENKPLEDDAHLFSFNSKEQDLTANLIKNKSKKAFTIL